MRYATRKSDSIDGVFNFDFTDCAFKYIKSILVNSVCEFMPQVIDEEVKEEITPARYLVDGIELLNGVYPHKNGLISSDEVFKISMFLDTNGTYGLIKNEAVDCIVELNDLDMPIRLQTGNGVAEFGDFVLIKGDGTTSVCDKTLFDLHQQA